jgi:putative transport protein
MLDWMYRLIFPSETSDVTQSLVVLLLAISIGFFVGRIKVKGITLGVSAVMFVGLGLGHYGYRINADILEFVRNFGLILFVYGIGIQVGPSFFSSFKKEGIRFNILAVSIVLFGGFITFLLFKFSTISIENAVGLMSGSVTNTPGLGAAKETLTEIQKQFPSKSFSDPTIAYAITYPLGVFGIIITIILSKTLLKINLGKESFTCDVATTTNDSALIIHQKCRVTNEAYFGKSIYQVLKEVNIQDVIISRLKNSGSQVVYAPSLDTKIHNKDVLMVVGSPAVVSQFIDAVGKVSSDLFIESEQDIVTKNLFVTKSAATHKTLAELDLYNKFDLKVTRVFRSGMELLAQPTLELYYGDKIRIVGNKEAIIEAEKIIGKKTIRTRFFILIWWLNHRDDCWFYSLLYSFITSPY